MVIQLAPFLSCFSLSFSWLSIHAHTMAKTALSLQSIKEEKNK